VFLKHGGFDEKFGRGEDVELGFRLEQNGVPFYYNGKASAIHRGYRSFDSWRASAHSYGHCEVVLAMRRGNTNQMLYEISRRYYARPPIVRKITELVLGRNSVREFVIQSLKATSGILSSIGLYKFAHPGYSIIFNIQYWHGVADELGGKEAFKQYVCDSSKAGTAANINIGQTKN
jgi:hypothetical protein